MAQFDFLTVIHDQNLMPTMEHLLALYKQKYGHTVQGTFVGWDTLWREITNAGIYRKGADLAEIGSTWMDSLVAMNCLRPFTRQEVARLGGREAFLEPSWSAVMVGDSDQVWGIPVRADVRILWYWEDMLDQAGLDPLQAFSSFDIFPQTFESLKKVTPTPWATVTAASDANALHMLSSWVWQSGGDFVSKTGREILFTEPAALKGMRAFFDLHRFMPRQQPDLTGNDVESLFTERKVAAAIGGPWLRANLAARGIDTGHIKATTIPGPAFVGGTVVIIFAHSRVPEPVISFLQFLTTPEIQLEYGPIVGLLPTLHRAWQEPPFSTDPLYQTLYKALLQGRTFPSVPLWGMAEKKLLNAVSNTWHTLLTEDQPNVESVIEDTFVALARRLELSLNS